MHQGCICSQPPCWTPLASFPHSSTCSSLWTLPSKKKSFLYESHDLGDLAGAQSLHIQGEGTPCYCNCGNYPYKAHCRKKADACHIWVHFGRESLLVAGCACTWGVEIYPVEFDPRYRTFGSKCYSERCSSWNGWCNEEDHLWHVGSASVWSVPCCGRGPLESILQVIGIFNHDWVYPT